LERQGLLRVVVCVAAPRLLWSAWVSLLRSVVLTFASQTFEITVVSGVTMVRTEPVAAPAAVQAANSFIEIWYDATPDANSLTGTGYNDGTRIYFGAPNAALGGFATQRADFNVVPEPSSLAALGLAAAAALTRRARRPH
jgi:hypothetical protein